MNVFSNFVIEERYQKGFKDLSHLDFSIFNDCIPTTEQLLLSSINIFVVSEPNEYFGIHNWVIQNKDKFSFILTCHKELIDKCDNAVYCPYGESWSWDNPFEYEPIQKEFKTSFLRGIKLQAPGHVIRHQIFDKQSEINTPIEFWGTLGTLDTYENVVSSKFQSFHKYMFSLCIENSIHPGYFTEKITDCIIHKTIPIYWGCPDISEYYNSNGLIIFNTSDEAINIINNLTPDDYFNRLGFIEENYNKAFEYKDYIKTIKNKITEIFKYNNIL
jgi:hypothetical protein